MLSVKEDTNENMKHVFKNWIKLGQQEKINYKLIKLLTP